MNKGLFIGMVLSGQWAGSFKRLSKNVKLAVDSGSRELNPAKLDSVQYPLEG